MEKQVYITEEERVKCKKVAEAFTELYLMAKGTPLLEKGYKGAFESLPEEKQSILIGRKAAFAFPQAVNGVFHSSIASYAHFHDAVLNVLFS